MKIFEARVTAFMALGGAGGEVHMGWKKEIRRWGEREAEGDEGVDCQVG